MVIPIILPPMLLVMLAGSAATSVSMGLARLARRGLKLGRDHVADGEAVRVTHFPEALIDALRKIGGRGAFEGSYAVEGLLFDAPPDRDGGRRAPVAERIEAIARLGGAMMDAGRKRRDTRAARPAAAPAGFGRKFVAAPATFASDAAGRPLEEPATPTLAMLGLYFTDRAAFWRWQHACIAWYEWRSDDRRNALGLTPKMVIPVAAVSTFLLVFHWPDDGDLSKLRATFDPAVLIEMSEMMDATSTFCSGGSACGGGAAPAVPAAPAPIAAPVHDLQQAPDFGAAAMPILVIFFLLLGAFRPDLLRRLFGVKR
jgi:hypothetical protein